MNFFDAQDRARRATKWLVVIYVVATILIVAGVTLIIGVGLFSIGVDGRPIDYSVLAVIAIAATPVYFWCEPLQDLQTFCRRRPGSTRYGRHACASQRAGPATPPTA